MSILKQHLEMDAVELIGGPSDQDFVLNEQTVPHQGLRCPQYLWNSSSGRGDSECRLKVLMKDKGGAGEVVTW